MWQCGENLAPQASSKHVAGYLWTHGARPLSDWWKLQDIAEGMHSPLHMAHREFITMLSAVQWMKPSLGSFCRTLVMICFVVPLDSDWVSLLDFLGFFPHCEEDIQSNAVSFAWISFLNGHDDHDAPTKMTQMDL